MVLQPHSMSNMPHAGRLRKRRKIGQNQLRSYVVGNCGFTGLVGMALAGCHTVRNRLSDLRECSKESAELRGTNAETMSVVRASFSVTLAALRLPENRVRRSCHRVRVPIRGRNYLTPRGATNSQWFVW